MVLFRALLILKHVASMYRLKPGPPLAVVYLLSFGRGIVFVFVLEHTFPPQLLSVFRPIVRADLSEITIHDRPL